MRQPPTPPRRRRPGHGRLQLPPRPRPGPRPGSSSSRAASAPCGTSAPPTCRTGSSDPDGPDDLAHAGRAGRVRGPRRPRRAHRRPGPLPDRRRGHRGVRRSPPPSPERRPLADGAPGTVTVDDAVVFTARLASGALASFEVTRCATGRKNGLRVELNGTAGSLAFDLERLNELEVFDAGADPGSGRVPPRAGHRGDHPYLGAWWPPGHVLGWEHTFTHQARDLLAAIAGGHPAARRRSPTAWRCSGYSTQGSRATRPAGSGN